MAGDREQIHKNHRQRVKDSFFEYGFDGVPDHKVLEAILFLGIPRKDTNEIAHELINTFGSFSRVLEARKEDLMNIKGMTENACFAIMSYLPVYRRYSECINRDVKRFENCLEVAKFVEPLFLRKPGIESVYLICIDADNNLICCRHLGDGSISNSIFNIREATKICLEVDAQKIVVAHNHPHGIALPSKEDINLTRYLVDYFEKLKISLVDHVIVVPNGSFSMANSLPNSGLFKDTIADNSYKEVDSSDEVSALQERLLNFHDEDIQL